MILWLVPTIALAGTKEKSSTFDWNPVIDAIIAVESEGNAKAIDYSGRSCGILQITPVLVKECNRILKILKSTKRYVLGDRFNAAKSKEMFLLYQSFYNPQNDVEKAIRSWNRVITSLAYNSKSDSETSIKIRFNSLHLLNARIRRHAMSDPDVATDDRVVANGDAS